MGGSRLVAGCCCSLHDAAQKAKGRLCGKRAGSPAALSADVTQPSVAPESLSAAHAGTQYS